MCIYVKRLVVDRLFVHKTSLLLLLFSLWRQTKTWNIFFLFLFCIQILISFQICAVYEITFLNCCGDSFVLWHLAFSFQTALQFFVRLCDSSPPVLHFIVLNSYKSASLTCQLWSYATFHIKGDICKRARSNTILVDLLSFITSITTDIYHTSERKTRV